MPLLLYIDMYLIYILGKVLRSRSKFKVLSSVIITSALIVPVFMLALFFDFKTWPPALVFLLFSGLSVFYAAKIISAILLGINHLFDKIIYININIHKHYYTFVALIALIIVSVMTYGLFFTVRNIKITEETITIEHLPEDFNNLNIIHISDLHLGSWLSKHSIIKMVKIINELEPDLIFITGDIVNFHSGEVERFDSILSLLDPAIGTFSVLGNHDYGNYVYWDNESQKEDNLEKLVASQESYGWEVLRNESIAIEKNGKKLIIAGVENWGAESRFPKKGCIEEAIKEIDTTNVILLLSHDPSYWENVIKDQYSFIDITFSGHTHGLQMGLTNKQSAARLLFKYWGGLFKYKVDNHELYLNINTGMGFLGYPGRVGVRPEITKIKLVNTTNKN